MTDLSTAPAEETLSWSSPDPQPYDLTEVYDNEGYLFECDRFDGLWRFNGGIGKSWNVLLERFGPVTRYRPVSDAQLAVTAEAGGRVAVS